MQVISELESYTPQHGTLLTVGVFDGVHLGHQHLILRLIQQADSNKLLSGVVTFSSHPEVVLSAKPRLPRLTTIEEKIHLLEGLGVDIVVPLTFSIELAALSAREFVVLLQENMKMQGLVIGPDFAMGRGRGGDAAGLKKLGQELNFTVSEVEPFILEGVQVSSTAIREALAEGDMKTTSRLLGRNFNLNGMVVGGKERGQSIGFPTANIEVDSDHALPADGVYATLGHTGDKVYESVTNIGTRPTFGEGERTIEVFLLGFSEDIYGQRLNVELVERLRGEKKFSGPEELAAQIGKDVEQARAILG